LVIPPPPPKTTWLPENVEAENVAVPAL